MQIEKIRITEPIAHALVFAYHHSDRITDEDAHYNTLYCLLNHDCLIKSKYNFADFKPIDYILTDKGKRITKRILEG